MKHLIPCLLAGILAAHAQSPNLTSADLWKPANAPFYFKYDGKDSNTILPNWQASDENANVAGQQVRRYISSRTHYRQLCERWTTHRYRDDVAQLCDVAQRSRRDFYALTPWTLEDFTWAGWQFNRPDKKDGCVILLKRGSSLYTAMNLGLRHLDPDATYKVEMRHTLDKLPIQEMKGSELSNLKVELPGRPDSEIIFYRQK